jgi:membrane-bound lytic murein transglycosylase D
MIKKIICTALTVLVLVPSIVLAQNTSSNIPDAKIDAIIATAEQHYELGQEALQAQSMEAARVEFDRSVDTILKGGLDTRSYPRLKNYYLSLIEKIHNQELLAASRGDGPSEQQFEPSLLDELAQVELDRDDIAAGEEAIEKPSLDFAFTLTPQVLQFIHYFSQNPSGRATMASGLQRAGRYLSLAKKVFKEEKVPQDLVWLAQAESNWKSRARSWAGAVGIWQFISGTGQRYGLRQNQWIDERSGIEQATRASARYLRFLYNRFNDWQLAMAAYNCGEGRIDSAIASTGYSDFWYFYNRGMLPRETSNYVPIILSIIIIAKNPERFGFGHIKPDHPLKYDAVPVNDSVDLRLVAEITNMPYEMIEELNPELKRGKTPPAMRYNLRLPSGTGAIFNTLISRIPEDQRDSWRVIRVKDGETLASIGEQHRLEAEELAQINKIEAEEALRPGTPLVLPVSTTRSPIRNQVEPSSIQIARASTTKMSITVRPGDNLTMIAARYGVSARDLAKLNRISTRAKLRTGQRLYLNVPNKPRPVTVPVSRVTTKTDEHQATSHLVRRGETLQSIARRYDVSLSDLREWNRLRSSTVKYGQRLVLTPPGTSKPERSTKSKPSGKKISTHRVRKGDTLSSIAERHGITVSTLKSLNRIKSNKVLVGSVLTVTR